jgi:hypothetical protein
VKRSVLGALFGLKSKKKREQIPFELILAGLAAFWQFLLPFLATRGISFTYANQR